MNKFDRFVFGSDHNAAVDNVGIAKDCQEAAVNKLGRFVAVDMELVAIGMGVIGATTEEAVDNFPTRL